MDYTIKTLGECKYDSPLNLDDEESDNIAGYISDDTRIFIDINYRGSCSADDAHTLEKAGPRSKIFFRPGYTRAALVTCGGISPGLNNVIRSIFMQLYYRYGVRNIIGFRYGFQGFCPDTGLPPILLTPEIVESIHRTPGTFLGTSRGERPPELIVDRLEHEGVHILFTIGGDGTQKAAHAIHEEIERRGLEIAVVGVPKTIDNDINFVYKTFGFDTAVGQARNFLECAHAEAHSHPNGIGLVKVMGRDSGFIAAHATIASREVNFTLVPEFPFELEGENGLLYLLEQRLKKRDHAVIIVAEGAGQNLMGGAKQETDASGNVRYNDIGIFLRDEIKRYFAAKNIPINLKYIDPSYTIRSVLPTANDSVFCDNLSRYAVHAAMAGKTDLVIGLWYNVFTHVPIEVATAKRKTIQPRSNLWLSVLEATGQPPVLTNGDHD